MYNQSNHIPHLGNNPRVPMPPAYQQHPRASSHFQQNPLVPPPRTTQQVLAPLPNQIALPSPHIYHFGPPIPHPGIHQGPHVQVPTRQMQNADQASETPPPLVHGSYTAPQTISIARQNSHHPSHMEARIHNHDNPLPPPLPMLPPQPPHPTRPPPPPALPQPDMSQAPFPPTQISPPALSSKEQALHKTPPPAQSCGRQSLQHFPLPSGPHDESLRQTDDLKASAEGNLTSDSDMEIEDDITISDKDQIVNHSIENLDEQFSGQKNLSEKNTAKEVLSKEVLCFGSSRASKHNEGPGLLSDYDQITKSAPEVKSLMINTAQVAECPNSCNFEKSTTQQADDIIQAGALPAADVNNSGTKSDQLVSSRSPIRLLQDYASDNISDSEDKTCHGDADLLTVARSVETVDKLSHNHSGSISERDMGCKSPSCTEKGLGLRAKVYQEADMPPNVVNDVKDTPTASVSSGIVDECVDNNLEHQVSVNFAASGKASQKKEGPCSSGFYNRKSIMSELENEMKMEKLKPTPLKVDEFGRLAREEHSNSDSGNSYRPRSRRGDKRDRSRSRSRSPLDWRSRRRRRRSPWKRKQRRSVSHSWSPRNRRSRSRSPLFRHSSKFSDQDMRREKVHRGAHFRSMRNELSKNAGSRRFRNKHDPDDAPSLKNFRVREEITKISARVSGPAYDGYRSQDKQHPQEVTGSSIELDADLGRGKFDRNALQSSSIDPCSESRNVHAIKSEICRQIAAKTQETLLAKEKIDTRDNGKNLQTVLEHCQPFSINSFPSESLSKAPFDNSDAIPLDRSSVVLQSLSVRILEKSDHASQLVDESFVSDSLPAKRSITSGCKVSSTEPLPLILQSISTQPDSGSAIQLLSSDKLRPHDTSVPLNPYQLPPAAATSPPRRISAPYMSQISGDNGLMPHTSFFPHQSAPRGIFQPHQASFSNPHVKYPAPPNSSFPSLPPPPPPLMSGSNLDSGFSNSVVSSQPYQSQLHLRNDFSSLTFPRPFTSELPAYSQVSEFQNQAYPPMQEPVQVVLSLGTSTSNLPPGVNFASQPIAGPKLGGEGHVNQSQIQDSKLSKSSCNMRPQGPEPIPFTPESSAKPPSWGILPPEELMNSSSRVYPFSQQQQPPYNLQYCLDNTLSQPAGTVSKSAYLPDIRDRTQSAHVPDFGVSGISPHYNPFASTFDQPLPKYSSSLLRPDKDKTWDNNYDISSHLNSSHIKGQGIYGVGPGQATTSTKSDSVVAQVLHMSGGEQYDPIFDIVERKSNSLKGFDFDQKQEVTGESDIGLKHKDCYKPLEAEENMHKEDGVIASTTSQNNGEYGETADAEVGVVDNESLSNSPDIANVTMGEVEIDQKSTGKGKKSKDSKSMKLFKVAIANFVKEVLKPSWRQGNMSKVAFKTIVKKTVDKVSGTMKGHHVPKSQAKINQYIDSSQRKLTKLVMGYVDKYVKV